MGHRLALIAFGAVLYLVVQVAALYLVASVLASGVFGMSSFR
jgi:hypothetical protein